MIQDQTSVEHIRNAMASGSMLLNRLRDDPFGIKGQEFTALRLSSSGGCAAALALKGSTRGIREVDEKGSRIFELGHQRGESLLNALKLGMDSLSMSEEVPTITAELPVRMKIGDASDPMKLLALADAFPGMVSDVRHEREADGSIKSATASLYAKGHLDGFIQGAKFDRVVEIKTMNPFVIKKVEEDKIGTVNENYITQLACYETALVEMGITTWERLLPGLFICEDKANCALKLVELPHDQAKLYAGRAKARFARVVQYLAEFHTHNGLTDPGVADLREYAPDGNGKLPWQCNYCDVAKLCWGSRLKSTESKAAKPQLYVIPEIPEDILNEEGEA